MDFSEIRDDFNARVQRIVWCTVTTVDTKGRPRSRILHPYWEETTAWVLTSRHSLKEKHLAANPHVAISYWDPQHQQVYAEGIAEWEDGQAEKTRIWETVKATPEPYGWDPGMIWSGPDDPGYGLLKITPRRIELSALSDLPLGKGPRVWKA